MQSNSESILLCCVVFLVLFLCELWGRHRNDNAYIRRLHWVEDAYRKYNADLRTLNDRLYQDGLRQADEIDAYRAQIQQHRDAATQALATFTDLYRQIKGPIEPNTDDGRQLALEEIPDRQ